MKCIFNILHKTILIVVAIQLLNLSFNNLNSFYSDNAAQSFEYSNQIDSAFEFFTEHIMGWENFVPENKHNPHHQINHFHKAVHLCWYSEVRSNQDIADTNNPSFIQIIQISSIPIGYAGDINPPPPKA